MKRIATIAVTAGLALLLAGCLLMPGKFTSGLDLRKDGTFSFSYRGEITMLALSDIAEQAKKKEDGKASSKKDAEEKAMMDAMLGGMDPGDPKASAVFAEKLRKQAGFRQVTDKGHGVFEVDYAISGRLDHDFTFPSIEQMPMVTPFVAVYRHADGTVRVETPAFSPSAGGGPFMAMMLASAKNKAAKNAAKDDAGADEATNGDNADGAMADAGGPDVSMPEMDGTFDIVTDGQILANNTEEGPQAVTGGRKLGWTINAHTTAPPTALIRLGD
ncbi:hypothetical protein RXV95_12495 [Novosphingobium sp. ZN18A2]|uniref:hypothetical protein n=1 Tax=Novosphingobium sp. ZN18A2 TaxID=3079861 RepID=UPI0030D2F1F0